MKGLMDILIKKKGRPSKVGKPNYGGSIADNLKRLAKKNSKKKCKSCGGKGCSKCSSKKGY
jgi:hypothetical protein